MHQPDLFDRFREPLLPQPCDPHVVPQDRARLTGQCAEILELLRAGPRTNQELSQVSLKYTSRISDLRAAGYKVACERMHGGVTLYRLGGRNDPYGSAVGKIHQAGPPHQDGTARPAG